MFKKHNTNWVKAQGRVVALDRQTGVNEYGAAEAWVDSYVVDVQPTEGEPFRAEVEPGGFNHGLLHVESSKFRHPQEGEVVSVEYDPASRKVRFDMSDPALVKQTYRERNATSHTIYEQSLGAPVGTQSVGGTAADVLASLGVGGGGDLKAQLLRMAAQNPGSVIDLRSSHGSADSSSDPVDRLAKLADLKERGVLTEAEFEAEKQRILGEN
jgi:hypothetical protein